MAAAFAAIAPAAHAGDCSAPGVLAETSHGPSTPAHVPLYLFDKEEKLWRVDLGTSARQRVEIASLENPRFDNSPDSSWVAHSGFDPRTSTTQVWLLETATGKESLVASIPGRHGWWMPAFSPDNRWLAIYPDEGEGIGLYLVEVARKKGKYFGRASIPNQSPELTFVRFDWSADSSRLMFRAASPKGNRTFAFDPVGSHWFADGKSLQRADGVDMPSNFGHRSLASADGRLKARVDPEHRLMVEGEGRSVLLATGRYDECLGSDTVSVIGWVDGHRFLLFDVDMDVYVYDTQSGRRSPLVDRHDRRYGFFWQGPASN